MQVDTREVMVWDPFVRVFHWTLVVGFAIAYFSGDEAETLHVYVGYLLLGLVGLRILWGFVGSRHARFSDFVRGPRAVIAYMRSLAGGRPRHYLGHNPAGGWMVLMLLVANIYIGWTGLELYAVEEGKGPLAGGPVQMVGTAHANGDDDEGDHKGKEAEEELWEALHEAAVNLTLILILIHVLGVMVSSRLHHEHLVKAMITGRKTLPPDTTG